MLIKHYHIKKYLFLFWILKFIIDSLFNIYCYLLIRILISYYLTDIVYFKNKLVSFQTSNNKAIQIGHKKCVQPQ